MKKTFSKALSLLLVLAMLLSVIPMALATEEAPTEPGTGESSDPTTAAGASVTITGPETAVVGDTVIVSVAVANVDTSKFDVTYKWNQGTPGNTDTVTMKIEEAVNHTFYCTVSFTAKNEADAALTPAAVESDKHTVAVTAVPTGISLPEAATVRVGKNTTLTATVTPGAVAANKLTWKSSDETVATVDANGKVTGVKAGTATITAAYGTGDDAVVSNACTVTVAAAAAVLSVKDMVVNKGEDYQYAELVFTPALNYDARKALKLTVTHTGDDCIEDVMLSPNYNYIVFEAVKAGKAEITVSSATSAIEPVTFKVVVSDGTIKCDPHTEEALSGADHTLKPIYYAGFTILNDTVTFQYEELAKRGNISVDAATGKVSLGSTSPAAIKVGITAIDKESREKVAYGETYVSFYVENNVTVSMPANNRSLIFGDVDHIKESGRLDGKLLENYDTDDNSSVSDYSDTVKFDDLTATEGILSANSCTVSSLPRMVFTAGTNGTASFNFAVTPGETFGNLPLCQGKVIIRYDGADGDIVYSTTYNKAVTFSETDFYRFWKSCGMTGGLDYVMITRLPTYGTLYTSAASTSAAYAASTNDKFYYGAYAIGANNEDLGTLTYVPLSTKTTAYDVAIPFVAYGEKAGEEVSGYVVIHLNETSNPITSRGIFFGTEYDTKNDLTYADQIAIRFKEQTGENLDYVIFSLPDVEEGTLFSRIPTDYNGNSLVAQGTRLHYTQKLYYNNTSSTQSSLERTALIPAAGFYGTITLKYTGYSSVGDHEYSGIISFTVSKKTKSAMFSDVATSYSWAADSVDFLYYEGTAQGSNGKYNPASNITRGDFMLMLYRAFLADDYGDYNVTNNFSDVIKGTSDYSKETYQAVGVAKYLGIAQGTNGKYNPKANITREEAMTLIYRTLVKMNRDLSYTKNVSASVFKDYSKISDYAKNAISYLVSHGVIEGSNNNINPKTNITRAEMACILHRVITY